MDEAILLKEIKYKAVRASGSGGQHVNKVSTKVELFFDLVKSEAFREDEKLLLQTKLANRLTKDGLIIIQSQDSRSQLKNKNIAEKKLIEILKEALVIPRKRKKTIPSKNIIEKRLHSKRITSEKKKSRQKPLL